MSVRLLLLAVAASAAATFVPLPAHASPDQPEPHCVYVLWDERYIVVCTPDPRR